MNNRGTIRKAGIRALTAVLLAAVLCLQWAGPAKAQEVVKKATVSGQVVDTQGAPLVSQLVFSAEEASLRINTDLFGRFKTQLPLGEYTVEVSRGSLYERKAFALPVPDRNQIYLDDIALSQLYETAWLAGDLHQHTIYSFDGSNSPFEVYLSDLSAGLDFGAVTDHNDIRANGEFVFGDQGGFIGLPGIEITTNRGHFNAIRFNRLPDPDTSRGADDVQRIIRDVRQDPAALLQINHPDRTEGGFEFQDWELAPQFDLMEVWNGKGMPPCVAGGPNQVTLERWLALIRDGLYLPATGGSDNHDISGNLMFARDTYKSAEERYFNQGMFSGAPRTYVLAAQPTPEGIAGALRRGNNFVTNNPLAFLTVEGVGPGERVRPGTLQVKVLLQSNRAFTAYRLRVNGEDAPWVEISGNVFEREEEMTLRGGDFVMLEAKGEHGDYAFTNPVFVAQ